MTYPVARSMLLAGALLMASAPAVAATYQSFHCKCNPPACGDCTCTDSYTLGSMVTKEFRAYCDNVSEESEAPNLNVDGKSSSTTCTVQISILGQPYKSKSCTNWSLFHSDGLSIKVTCHDWHYDTDSGSNACN